MEVGRRRAGQADFTLTGRMGGVLVAESEGMGRGAIFTLELPIQLQKSHP